MMKEIVNVLLSLCSGAFGALLVFIWQLLYDKRKEKKESINLAEILIHELSSLRTSIEPDLQPRASVSLNIWHDLTSEVVRLLPPNIVRRIAEIYSSIDLLINSGSTTSPLANILLENVKHELKNTIDDTISDLKGLIL